jgi:hypothetical protein
MAEDLNVFPKPEDIMGWTLRSSNLIGNVLHEEFTMTFSDPFRSGVFFKTIATVFDGKCCNTCSPTAESIKDRCLAISSSVALCFIPDDPKRGY